MRIQRNQLSITQFWVSSRSVLIILNLLIAIEAFATLPPAGSLQISIDRISTTEGTFSINLVPQLHRQAELHFRNSDYGQAIESLLRIQNLIHRHWGVNSILQFEVIDFLIDIYVRTGKLKLADQLHDFRFRLATNNFPSNALEMLVPLKVFATWHRDKREYKKSIELYEQAEMLLGQYKGRLSDRIEILELRSLALYLSGVCCADEPLLETFRLIADYEDGTSKLNTAEQVSDLSFLIGNREQALAFLGTSIEKLVSVNRPPKFLGFAKQQDIYHSFATTKFPLSKFVRSSSIWLSEKKKSQTPLAVLGNPVPLCRNAVQSLLFTRSFKRLDDYFIDVKMRVTKDGRGKDIRLNGVAPIKLKRYFRNVLSRAVYRPETIENNVPRDATLSFRQFFHSRRVSQSSDWGLILNLHACSLIPHA